GSVGRQLFQGQSRIILEELADFGTLVHGTTIPDHDHRAAQMLEQLAQEPGDGKAVVVIVDKAAEVQPQLLAFRRQAEGGDQRDFVASSALMSDFVDEDRSLPFGSQTATNKRRHEQTALVDQYQMGT